MDNRFWEQARLHLQRWGTGGLRAELSDTASLKEESEGAGLLPEQGSE